MISAIEIRKDIEKLKVGIFERRENISALKQGIDNLRKEQEELRKYLSGEMENKFDPEALKKNIERIDWQIEQVNATIRKEEAGIKQFQQMIDVLEKKWQSVVM